MIDVTFYLIVGVTVIFLYQVVLYHWKRRFLYMFAASLPGPTGTLPLIGDGLAFGVDPSDFVGNMRDVLEKFPSGFRMWLGPTLYYVITSPEHLEMYLMNTVTNPKGAVYKEYKITFGNGLIVNSDPSWRTHRRLVNRTMTKSILDNYVSEFSSHSRTLVHKLSAEVNGPKFNLLPYIQDCVADVVCETLMGIHVNMQANLSKGFVHHVTAMMKMSGIRAAKPWLYPDFVFFNSKYGKQHKQSREIVTRFIEGAITEKIQAFKDNNNNVTGESTLEKLIPAVEETGEMTRENLFDEVLTLYLAAQDPIETMVSVILLMLAIKQDIQEKVHEELVHIYGSSSRSVTAADLPKMKYLEMVIKESLRVFCPTILSRTIREDCEIGGLKFPAGCNLLFSPYITHRLPQHWGLTPDVFDPDHFLPERVAARHPYAYVPFSVGQRACAGQMYGLLAIKTITAEVLRKYIVSTDQKEADIKMMGAILTKPKGGFKLQIRAKDI